MSRDAGELRSVAKIFLFLVVPFSALCATFRVGMTAIGLDAVPWGRWPEAFFGIAGINLAIPIFALLLLGLAGGAGPAWAFIRSAPREYVALARSRVARRLVFALLFILTMAVLPIVAVWLFPDAWTHWRTWLAVGLAPLLPALWRQLFRSESKRDGLLGAIAIIVACVLTTMMLHDMHTRAVTILWLAPFMSASVPFLAGIVAGDFSRHIRETRKGQITA